MISKESQKMLTEIRDSCKFCCISIKSDFNYVWYIDLTKDDRTDNLEHKPNYRTCAHEDLNDAVKEIYEIVRTNETN